MSAPDMFAPPFNRAMKVLDQSFQKTIPTAAARIFNAKDISRVRNDLDRSHDVIKNRFGPVRPDPDTARAKKGGKCILLRPEVVPSDRQTWSTKLQELESASTVGVILYQLQLDYGRFTYAEITSRIIPPPEKVNDDELPTGFTQTGHVAHFNLRERYLPYKYIIEEVLVDKTPLITTAINKFEDVGSEYCTFQYEVLHGPDNLNVENTRLHTKHERLYSLFNEGDAVCDVMAGVGPFAVPAGKKSYKYLEINIKDNNVGDFVRPFNTDGHDFIRSASAELLKTTYSPIYPKVKKASRKDPKPAEALVPLKTLVQPRIFAHYVMNLPASAITFLPSFIGLYTRVPDMPMIHVHCFSTKSDDNVAEKKSICEEISRQLDHEITPETPDVHVHDVRDVAPKKRMFCASFRLPEEVAFREV
ncbi:hypothetical protein K458DRAFT_396694 [Lentithecium fluviatile CBS 122367]|uniref:tRNA (guanine(37)-N1)-methyltransferase n=1 Tax=Lentithecium fluviatile CBS 122367 TaxID=1168545 RepID=A0A6G1IFI1_9PLEO|nr:hypothetical protein K458DRAFT_396694 [Lentithecium fluviatile CBS 122367]